MEIPSQNDAGGRVPEFTVGDRLRKARESAGLEMSELAAAIDVHRQTVARYETGAAKPRRYVVLSWSIATGVDMDWIMSGAISTHDERSDRTIVLAIH